jgi:hypothetical protein
MFPFILVIFSKTLIGDWTLLVSHKGNCLDVTGHFRIVIHPQKLIDFFGEVETFLPLRIVAIPERLILKVGEFPPQSFQIALLKRGHFPGDAGGTKNGVVIGFDGFEVHGSGLVLFFVCFLLRERYCSPLILAHDLIGVKNYFELFLSADCHRSSTGQTVSKDIKSFVRNYRFPTLVNLRPHDEHRGAATVDDYANESEFFFHGFVYG